MSENKKKDGKALYVILDREIYRELEEYCTAVGQTKTAAIENILDSGIKSYFMKDKDQRKAL